MKRWALLLLLLGLALPGEVFSQGKFSGGRASVSVDEVPVSGPIVLVDSGSAVTLGSNDALPTMSPELALATFLHHTEQQVSGLASYSAITVIHAELPDTSQSGEYELQRRFEAPHTLLFTPLHFTGDGFVKSNVITRLLQSEVDHVQKDDPAETAITPVNYKFTYKGASRVGDRLVHVYQVKPHKKHAGLFKGRVYLDAQAGTLVRIEGNVVKSPSFFVKHIEFVQDYADVQSFTLPVHIHSEAKARIVGRTIVDIVHRDYQPVPVSSTQTARQVPAM